MGDSSKNRVFSGRFLGFHKARPEVASATLYHVSRQRENTRPGKARWGGSG
jgi:hypothetical protein